MVAWVDPPRRRSSSGRGSDAPYSNIHPPHAEVRGRRPSLEARYDVGRGSVVVTLRRQRAWGQQKAADYASLIRPTLAPPLTTPDVMAGLDPVPHDFCLGRLCSRGCPGHARA